MSWPAGAAPETWDNLMMGLRLGVDPRCVVTTTPRPTKLMRTLIAKETTVETRASTYANRANLAPAFFDDIVSAYEGTRLGRQEIYGELLEDVPGALWSHARIDELRVSVPAPAASCARWWSPSIRRSARGEDSDETGICVVALGEDGHGYVLADAAGATRRTAGASCVIDLYHDYQADRVVAEANNGGDLVTAAAAHRSTLPAGAHGARQPRQVRARRTGELPLRAGARAPRRQLPRPRGSDAGFTPDLDRATQGSPDRVDALVWGLSEVLVTYRGPQRATGRRRDRQAHITARTPRGEGGSEKAPLGPGSQEWSGPVPGGLASHGRPGASTAGAPYAACCRRGTCTRRALLRGSSSCSRRPK